MTGGFYNLGDIDDEMLDVVGENGRPTVSALPAQTEEEASELPGGGVNPRRQRLHQRRSSREYDADQITQSQK